MSLDGYEIGFRVTYWIAFLATWAYAIATWGFLLGVGFGWIPAAIIGAIAAFLWPLLALLLCLAVIGVVVLVLVAQR